MSFGSHIITGNQPTSSIHTLWSISMNFSNLWKGLAVVAVLFLFSLEASAQLPVRTQNLQLINPAGGTITHTATAAGATAQSYTILWPEEQDHDNAPNAAGDQAILLGTWDASNRWTLEWIESDGFVDGEGDVNHVTWWNPDSQTLDHSQNFEWNGTRLGVGMNAFSTTAEATAAGEVVIGDGTAAQISMNVTPGEIIVGQNVAGNVEVTTAGNVTTVQLDGSNGTATLGNATSVAGSVVLYDGDAAGQTATLTSGAQVANVAVTFDVPSLTAPAGSRILPLSINSATTADEILFSNGDGTAEWRTNPSDYIQSGVVAMTGTEVPDDANAYTQFVAFTTDYSTLNPPVPAGNISVVLVTNGTAANANILQIGNITQTGFQVLSSAPLAGASINWMSMGNP